MKNLLLFKKFIIVIFFAGLSLAGWSQILYEDFNYATLDYIGGNGNAGATSNNWTTHSVTAGQITTIDIEDGNLTYPGLANSNGNKLFLFGNANATSRDVNRGITSTATTLYFSALINIVDNSQITTTGDYFMSFGAASGTSAGSLGGRLAAKSANSGLNFRFAIQNTSTGSTTFTDNGADLNFGTTYLVVVKYDRSISPTTASMWVDPISLGGIEASGFVSNTSGTGTFATFSSICLRNNATTPKANIDEIRVGETWAEVTPAGSETPIISVTSPAAGAEWPQGSEQTYTWTATGTNSDVKIEFSANASDVTPTWNEINSGIAANLGTWTSTIPADQTLGTDYKIRITDIPQTASGMSGTFSVVAAPIPVATFVPADGATAIDIAADITITFDVPVRNIDDSEITDVAALLTLTSTDAAGTAVPFTATIDAAKKVITIYPDADLLNEQLYYVAIAPVEGLSDNATVAQSVTFTTATSTDPAISDVTITEVSPYHAGDLITMNWVSKNVTDVQIEAWIPSESKWEILFSSTPSDGTETFIIPIDAQYSTDYKIRVTDVFNPGVTAESSIFTILEALSAVNITGVSPYFAGDTVAITWVSANITDVKIEVWFAPQSFWVEVFPSTPSDGMEGFIIPSFSPYSEEYKIRISDVSNATVNAESSVFTVIAVAPDLATLRLQPLNSMVKYTGIATVTYAQASRNQKYIQDATAAVLIDDPNPGFIGAYDIGEGITNIVGKMLVYHELIEFTPQAATGEHATGSVIIPEVRTLASLTPADQGKLVKIENFAFKTPTQFDPNGLFVKSKNYDIDGQDNTQMVYRTAFGTADYIGGNVPVGPISSVCIVGQFDAQMQITARSWSDIMIPTVAEFDATPTFIIEGESVQFQDMSSNNPTSWEWTFAGGTPATSTEQNPVIQYNEDGLYSVSLKVTNAFGDNTATKTDYVTVGGVGFSTLPASVSVYPNPTNGKLFISNPSKEKQEIVMFNAAGKQVKTSASAEGVISLDITTQSKGIYIVRITNSTSKSVQFKKVVLY